MTEQVPVWYREQWAQNVIVRFQARGFTLKGTTEAPVKIDGNKFYFLRTGSLEAQPYTRGDAVAVLNPDDDKIEMTSAEWDAAVAIYDFDVTRLPASEKQARQEQCVNALGRRSDRIVYDAVMAAPLPAAQIFGDYSAGFDPYLFKQGLVKLARGDVPVDTGIFAPIPILAFAQLETYKIFANADWIGGDLPLTKMVKHRTWDRANCFELPPHLEAANTSGTQLRFRVWAKGCIGAGHNDAIRNEWTREGLKKRWVANHTIDGCAKPLQTEGIIEFRIKADSAIAAEVVTTHAV
jgi:hypothetical protein